jgi:hypothetical protein
VGGSRRRQRGSGTERDAPRPMNRDIPPCTRALRAALQPLIGGAIERYRRAVALVRKRRLLFSRMRMVKHGCSHIGPSCLLVHIHSQSITTATRPHAEPPTADHASRARLISQTIRPSRVANTGDQPARAPVALSLHHCTQGATPDPARRSNGPWPHVTTGQLALPSNIAISLIHPLTRPALCRLSIKSDRVVGAWVPGARCEADWGNHLLPIDTIRARKGTTTPNLPAKGYLCSASRCCGSCLTSARA